ncbi:MAG: site-specific integrase, partial [Thermoleophilia bacterium]|nr:site-specific integrase [Thermoleophilia bacterium]
MAKRGQNEGSIIKLKDGTWRAYMNLGCQGGKRKRKYFRGKTRREVQEKLTEALRNRQLGLPVTGDKVTFGQYLERWLEDSVKPSVRPRTHEQYSQYVRLYIRPALGNIKLSKLRPDDIQALLNRQVKKGLSARTAQLTHSIIRRALGQAYQWQLVPRNVATLVRPPRGRRFEPAPLTPEQVRAFLEAVKGDRLEAFYTVATALGLRRGEALALRWEDIDLEAGALTVRHTLQNLHGGGWSLAEPKSRNSRRTLGLPAFALLALKEHRKRQFEEKLRQGKRWRDHGFVFTSIIGTPLDGNNMYKCFKTLLKENGLPDIRFHDLRHTAGTMLCIQGVHPRVAMETLGHSQIGLTMNLYTHVASELQREAADKIDALLSG